MRIRNRRTDEMSNGRTHCSLDLSELSMLYGERGLRTLLAVALDEFDCQRVLFDSALRDRQWMRAAHALHRLTGTAAFFVHDEHMLDPLNCAERALRLADASLIELATPRAKTTLAELRGALVEELANLRETD